MNSQVLKNQRDSFTNSCVNYLEIHATVLQKINEIDSILSSSSDSLLVEYLHDINAKIIKKINRLDNLLKNSRDQTVEKVDIKIMELEEEERLAALNIKENSSNDLK